MSEELGGSDVVKVMNQIFEIIGRKVEENDGEILKFIGDALLLMFPIATLDDHSLIASQLVDVASGSITEVNALGKKLNLPLSVGFGAHIGEVIYGNIGSANRLDFTVMGPAVNLTSRLESLCKPLQTSLVLSSEVTQYNQDRFASLGLQSVKGVSKPVEVWSEPSFIYS